MYTLIKLIEVSDLVTETKRIISEELLATYVDAEFEADQKLAELAMTGNVDLILTEDSDLIVYGCPKILYKFHGDSGMLYLRSKFVASLEFGDWSLFQKFCVLCGCDYYKCEGVAIQKAKKICRTSKSYALWEVKQTDKEIELMQNALKVFQQFN